MKEERIPHIISFGSSNVAAPQRSLRNAVGICMKGIWYTYKDSKYHDVICGIVFAFLGLSFLLWGITIISEAQESYISLVAPFAGILICLTFGLRSMFKHGKMKAEIY